MCQQELSPPLPDSPRFQTSRGPARTPVLRPNPNPGRRHDCCDQEARHHPLPHHRNHQTDPAPPDPTAQLGLGPSRRAGIHHPLRPPPPLGQRTHQRINNLTAELLRHIPQVSVADLRRTNPPQKFYRSSGVNEQGQSWGFRDLSWCISFSHQPTSLTSVMKAAG